MIAIENRIRINQTLILIFQSHFDWKIFSRPCWKNFKRPVIEKLCLWLDPRRERFVYTHVQVLNFCTSNLDENLFTRLWFFCSVETHFPNKLYEPVKVGEKDLTRDFLLLNLKFSWFQVRPEPTFEDRELGFNQEPFSIANWIKVFCHLLSIFPPDIRGELMRTSWNDRLRVKRFANKSVHFLRVVSTVHDVARRSNEFVTFFQKRESMSGVMDSAVRYHKSDDNLLIDIDNNRSFQEMFPDLSRSFWVIMTAISTGKPGWIDGSNRNCVIGEIE